jgi:hypothetical protein
MKHRPISKIISTLLLVMCCFFSSSAVAHTPHVREIYGVIQAIDCQKRILTLTHAQEPGPQKVAWRPDTQFIQNQKPMSVTELKTGTQVTVFYHSPFFGKPFATKVVWVTDVK